MGTSPFPSFPSVKHSFSPLVLDGLLASNVVSPQQKKFNNLLSFQDQGSLEVVLARGT